MSVARWLLAALFILGVAFLSGVGLGYILMGAR